MLTYANLENYRVWEAITAEGFTINFNSRPGAPFLAHGKPFDISAKGPENISKAVLTSLPPGFVGFNVRVHMHY